jgi:hypothetical protein
VVESNDPRRGNDGHLYTWRRTVGTMGPGGISCQKLTHEEGIIMGRNGLFKGNNRLFNGCAIVIAPRSA